jgi:hypothetical protein
MERAKVTLAKFFKMVRGVKISLLIEQTGETVALLLKKTNGNLAGFFLNPKAPKWLLTQLRPGGKEWEDTYFFPWNEEEYDGREPLSFKFLSLKLNSIADVKIEGRDWEEDIGVCLPHKLIISIYDKRKESDFPLCVTEVKYSRYSKLSKFIKFDEDAACNERVEEYGKLSAQAES